MHPFDIVHVTHSAYPADPRPRREAAVAAEDGRRVAVIALGDDRGTRVGRYGRITVIRLKGSKRRGSAGGYVREYVGFTARAWALIRCNRRLRNARVIHVHTLPDFLVAAAGPARRRGARIILDLHEIFPEFVRSKFPGLLGRFATPAARALERWSRAQADVTITVNRPIETLLRDRPARPKERIVVIHNSPAAAEFGEVANPVAVGGQPLRLVYHGTLTALYGVDLAIAAVARVRAGGGDVQLDVYGDGPHASTLATLVRDLDLTNAVRLHAPVPATSLPHLLRSAHAGLVPTRLDCMTGYSLSTKLLEYVHLGVPLIAPRLATYLEYFPEPVAWYFDANDAASMAGAIERVAEATPAARVERARAAQSAARRLSWSVDGETLRELYRDLLVAQPR